MGQASQALVRRDPIVDGPGSRAARSSSWLRSSKIIRKDDDLVPDRPDGARRTLDSLRSRLCRLRYQAEIHLDTFKRELENNELLRTDYPNLCAPATGERSRLVSNNRTLTIRENDFVFAAKGADASSSG